KLSKEMTYGGKNREKKQKTGNTSLEYRTSWVWTAVKSKICKRASTYWTGIYSKCVRESKPCDCIKFSRANRGGHSSNKLSLVYVLSMFVFFCYMGCI